MEEKLREDSNLFLKTKLIEINKPDYWVIEGQILAYITEEQVFVRDLSVGAVKECKLTLKKGTPKFVVVSPVIGSVFVVCVVCEDDSVWKYELSLDKWRNESNGMSIIKSGHYENPIKSIIFVNKNEEILIAESNKIWKRSLNVLKVIKLKQQPNLVLEDEIEKLLLPPKPIEGTIAICTKSEAHFYNQVKDTFEISFSVPCNDIIAFGPCNGEIFTFLTVYEGDKGSKCHIFSSSETEKDVFSFDVDFKPSFACFLSDSIAAVAQKPEESGKEGKVQLVTFIGSNSFKTTSIDFATSYFCYDNSIYSINEDNLYETKLLPFGQRMSDLVAQNKYDEACELCYKAANGNPWCIAGLPLNKDFSRIIIEHELALWLQKKAQIDLESDDSKSEEIIEGIINRWKLLSMRSAISDEFLTFFKDHNKLLNYFKAIIKTDPNATIFTYNKKFVEELLQTNFTDEPEKAPVFFENTDEAANNFILALPSKIAPPAEILRYASRRNNIELMHKVYITKLDDKINALNIMFKNQMYGNVLDVLLEFVKAPNATMAVKWLVVKSKEGLPFPHLMTIVQGDEEKVCELITTVVELIETEECVDLSEFVNALIISIGKTNIPSESKIFDIVIDLITNKSIILKDSTLEILIPTMFKTLDEATRFKPIIHTITQIDNVSDSILTKLIPLCDGYNFYKIKSIILMKLRQYIDLINFDLSNGIDVFLDIKNILELYPNSKDSLEKAIKENATLLALKDVKMFINILNKHFPAIKVSIAEYIIDNVRYHYIRTLLQIFPDVVLNDEMAVGYCKFICKYYPEEVLQFVQKSEKLHLLSKTCKEYHIYDACAFINTKISEFNLFEENIVKFFNDMSLKYIDGKDDAETFNKKSKFICDIFRDNIIADYNIFQYLKSAASEIIKNYCIPLYYAKERNLDIEPPQKGLLNFCLVAYSFIPFEKIITLIMGQYSDLSLDLIRPVLKEIFKDYSYDVDTSSSLAQIFVENEEEANKKYAQTIAKGIKLRGKECSECHERLTESQNVVVFQCGHVFHQTCAAKQTCPICFPEEVFNESDIKRVEIPVEKKEIEGFCVEDNFPDFNIDPSKFVCVE